ncbi:hypothetical protein MNBD_GAMMA17-2159, partial [hydrothermal vent metagenome]
MIQRVTTAAYHVVLATVCLPFVAVAQLPASAEPLSITITDRRIDNPLVDTPAA